jgi:hypothetical protein
MAKTHNPRPAQNAPSASPSRSQLETLSTLPTSEAAT